MADTPNRNMGWSIKEHGWLGFVERYIKPALDLGVTRFQLHNPAGTLPNEAMQADQYIEAKEAGLSWIYKDFVKAWRQITKDPKIEVIAYLGSLPEEDFTRLQSSRWTLDTYLQRLTDSYRYPLDAGCAIAFDAMHMNPSTSPEYHFMRMLQGLGVRTWIEPWPNIVTPHFWDCNHQTTVQLYGHINSEWAAPRDRLTGEGAIIMNQPPLGRTWQDVDQWCPKWCRQVIAENLTPIVALHSVIERRERLEAWLNRDVR